MSQFIELLATFHVSPVCSRGYEPSTTRSEARSTIAKLTHQKRRLHLKKLPIKEKLQQRRGQSRLQRILRSQFKLITTKMGNNQRCATGRGHEAGEACWPAWVEKLPWKLWEVGAESWKCSYVSDVCHAEKSKFEF